MCLVVGHLFGELYLVVGHLFGESCTYLMFLEDSRWEVRLVYELS